MGSVQPRKIQEYALASHSFWTTDSYLFFKKKSHLSSQNNTSYAAVTRSSKSRVAALPVRSVVKRKSNILHPIHSLLLITLDMGLQVFLGSEGLFSQALMQVMVDYHQGIYICCII